MIPLRHQQTYDFFLCIFHNSFLFSFHEIFLPFCRLCHSRPYFALFIVYTHFHLGLFVLFYWMCVRISFSQQKTPTDTNQLSKRDGRTKRNKKKWRKSECNQIKFGDCHKFSIRKLLSLVLFLMLSFYPILSPMAISEMFIQCTAYVSIFHNRK